MLAKRIAQQLRAALRDSDYTLWELARRTDLDLAEVAAALGGTRPLPADVLDCIGAALSLELSLTPAAPTPHPVGPVLSIVDQAVARSAPERLVYPADEGFTVLALGLEATLISTTATSTQARPGLYRFLECARGLFGRVVMFTSVKEGRFRQLAQRLVDDAIAPPWFAQMEFIHWSGPGKDLSFVIGTRPEQVLLVDATGLKGRAGQDAQWVKVEPYEPPFEAYDDHLQRVLQVLVDRLVAQH